MRTNLMRCFAVALGLSATAVPSAYAQYNPYVQQQTRQPAASRWNNFNVPAQQQVDDSQPFYGATQQQYGTSAQQYLPPQQMFRQVAQRDDDLLTPPRTNSGPEQIGPGIPQPNPHAQAPIQQQVPARGSYQPAPANAQPYQSPTPAPAPTYAPKADPYSNAPSVNYAPSVPSQSTILDPTVVQSAIHESVRQCDELVVGRKLCSKCTDGI
jgi:hypothetical protein